MSISKNIPYMIPIYRVTFFSLNDFYSDICYKLHNMRLEFHAERGGLEDWCFSVNDMTTEQKKVLCNFLRELFNNNEFHFVASFHVGYIDLMG